MISRIFIFTLALVILGAFANYIAFPFYRAGVLMAYLKAVLSWFSTYIAPVSTIVQLTYVGLPILFFFKLAFKKLVVHDN